MGKPCNAATYRKAAFDLALANSPKTVVEVGVYAGALSRMFAELPTLERQFIVDSWEGGYSGFSQDHMDAIGAEVKAWGATQPKLTIHHMRSADAAALFEDESIDFFHTDGDHSLEGITTDIRLWLPKVKTGSILSGDNYEIPAVAAGVKKMLPQHKLLANGRLWFAVK
ncbi:MAG TPA: class I SAM-dependent methyltransferase [Burkholderiaceae bacterium]|nr:class I SAM-dependent methyltransferase [Burkholderiaceae bacterium]